MASPTWDHITNARGGVLRCRLIDRQPKESKHQPKTKYSIITFYPDLDSVDDEAALYDTDNL